LPLELHYYELGDDIPTLSRRQLAVWPIPLRDKVIVGELNAANSDYVLEMLERATYACLDGLAAGMVTAPVQKSIINEVWCCL
jgi:4-hydroxythreonine-4-phosphate dehydrogenase